MRDSAITSHSSDWLLWQLADSAFPTGGFAHSGGLEAACQHREVRNGTQLLAWCEAALLQLQHGALPFVAAAHDAPPRFEQFDSRYDAFLSNHVANRASRAQGRSFITAVDRTLDSAAVRKLRLSLVADAQPGHLPPLHGVICHHLNISKLGAMRLFVFTQLRGWISSAVRLNIIGPLEAQSIQFKLTPAAEAAATGGVKISMDDAAQAAPLLDLFQATQDRLYSRLFQS